MKRKIGEIFEYNNEWYQCVKQSGCRNCAFYNKSCHLIKEISCDSLNREQKERYIFKKLEKAGSKVTSKGRTFQCFNNSHTLCAGCVFNIPNKACDKDHYIDDPCPDNEIWVEIKQNGKDTEEKKLTYEQLENYYNLTVGLWVIDRSPQEVDLNWIIQNAFQLGEIEGIENKLSLKQFDLKAAKAGKPVCTREGRRVRIVCFDKREKDFPIVALIEGLDGQEYAGSRTKDGKIAVKGESNDDLMMLPEKKEGWVNVYKGGLLDTKSYPSRKEAFDKASSKDYVDTVKINWNE